MSASGGNGRKSGGGGSWLGNWFGGWGSSSPRAKQPEMTPPPQSPKRTDNWSGPDPSAAQVRQAHLTRWQLGRGEHPDVIAKRVAKSRQPPLEPKPYTGFDLKAPGVEGLSSDVPGGGTLKTRYGTAKATAKISPKGIEVGAGFNLKESTYTDPSGWSLGTSLGVGGGFAVKEDGPTKTRVEVSAGPLSGGYSFDNKTVEDFVDFTMDPSKPKFGE